MNKFARSQLSFPWFGFWLVLLLWIWAASYQLPRFAGKQATTAQSIDWEAPHKAWERAAREGKPLFFYFTAEWCPPCKALAMEVLADSSVATTLTRGFVPVKVLDREREEGKNPLEVDELQGRFKVRSFPTLVVADPGGRELGRLVGYHGKGKTRRQLLRLLQEALAQQPSRTPPPAP